MPVEPIEGKPKKRRGIWMSLVWLLGVSILVGSFFYFCVRVKNIKSGYIGVKADVTNPVDNTSDYVVQEVNGYVVYMPFLSDLKVYPTTVQTVGYDAMSINANDGMSFVVKPRISFQLDEKNASRFYKSYKESIEQIGTSHLKEIVASAYALAAASFDSDSLARNIPTYDTDVSKILAVRMLEKGLILQNANANLEIPAKIKEIVDLKNMAIKNTILAQEQIRESYAKANIKRVEDSLINSALTSLAIQKMFIEKWDGRLSPNTESPKVYKDIFEKNEEKSSVH
ncbi:MAG: hypothetical protein RL662_1727 [Bacteroidota bacterium]|jgi:hypothetical protein